MQLTCNWLHEVANDTATHIEVAFEQWLEYQALALRRHTLRRPVFLAQFHPMYLGYGPQSERLVAHEEIRALIGVAVADGAPVQ